MPNTIENLEVIAHLGDHITYKEEYGICYDSALAKVIEDAYMTLKNGVTVQEWISVKDERKPKDRKNYFIAYVFGDSDMHFFGEAKYYAYEGNGIVDGPHFSNEGVDGMRVTHWMEIPKLPQPPKGE